MQMHTLCAIYHYKRLIAMNTID